MCCRSFELNSETRTDNKLYLYQRLNTFVVILIIDVFALPLNDEIG